MKIDEVLKRLAALRKKAQDAGEGAAPDRKVLMIDEVKSIFEDLKIAQEVEAPAPTPVRQAVFEGGGDKHYNRMERIAALPVETQKQLDYCYLASKLLKVPVKSLKLWGQLVSGSSELQKALDSTTGGEGDEWVPTGLSADLIKFIDVNGTIESMHRTFTMPTQPFELPIQIGNFTAYKVAEQTGDTGQTKVTVSSGASFTSKITFTAQGLGVRVLVSKYLEEDSLVPMLPIMREEIAKAIIRGIENACINGDASVHMDTDITGTVNQALLWKGFRALSQENSYEVDFGGAGNAFDVETFLKVRAQLGKYGINPAEGYWVVGLSNFFRMLTIKDSANNNVVLTLDKIGPQATVSAGTMGMFMGSELKVSDQVREVLDSNGIFDAAGDKTAVHYVSKPGLAFGDRRQLSIQLLTEIYAESEQDALQAVIRKDFQPLYPIASNAVVATGINVAKS